MSLSTDFANLLDNAPATCFNLCINYAKNHKIKVDSQEYQQCLCTTYFI